MTETRSTFPRASLFFFFFYLVYEVQNTYFLTNQLVREEHSLEEKDLTAAHVPLLSLHLLRDSNGVSYNEHQIHYLAKGIPFRYVGFKFRKNKVKLELKERFVVKDLVRVKGKTKTASIRKRNKLIS